MPVPPRHRPDQSGFTLIELLVAMSVMGIIASGVAASIILFFSTTDATANRLALSHDSQLLATYLTPDLDNLTGSTGSSQPVTTPPGACTSSTGAGFSDLQIHYTDLSSQHVYLADYAVNGSQITRTFSVDGQAPDTTIVVHNLKATSLPLCTSASTSGAAPWTITVTTETNQDPSTDYTFSVTGGGRVTTPVPLGAPVLCGPPQCTAPPLVSVDTNNDGHINQVIATFDQPLNTADTVGISQWHLEGPPAAAGVTLQSVAVNGNQAILQVSTPTGAAIDTAANGLAIALAPDPNGIRNGANQDASFGATPVTDGIAPMPISAVSEDTNHDGKVNVVAVTFTEPLRSQSYYSKSQWTLSGQPPGVTLNSVSASGNTATLNLNQGSTVDTVAAGFQVALTANPAGIQDANGNQASFPAMTVADGMSPVPTSIIAEDTNHDGKVNQVVATFSEALVPSTDTSPWRLWGQPQGVTLKAVNVSGNTATLLINEGTTYDTAASGMQVSLAYDPAGVKSANTGNVSSFGPTTVSDGMSPVVVGLSSTDVYGGTAGQLQQGDTLTLTFSEPLLASSLPAYPTLTLTPGAGSTDDMLTISGVATIDLGASNSYGTPPGATFAASVTSKARVVTITVGPNTGGSNNLAAAAAATNMTVTPAATVSDLANPANVAAGTYSSNQRLF